MLCFCAVWCCARCAVFSTARPASRCLSRIKSAKSAWFSAPDTKCAGTRTASGVPDSIEAGHPAAGQRSDARRLHLAMCDELKRSGGGGGEDGGGDDGDGGGDGSGGLGGDGGSSVAAGFEILGRGEQERDATLNTNTFCTAPSLQDTRPGGADGPSAASALGSAGDGGGAGGEDGGGDDGDDGDDGGGGSAYSAHTWATLSAPKASKTKKPRKRAKKKKAPTTAPGGGEAGAEAQLASGRS